VSTFALAWRNLVRQKRRTILMGAVVAFGFAAVALAGGFIAQSFAGLKEGTIRTVGQLQIVDKRAVKGTEEKTLEFGLYPFVPGDIFKLYLAAAVLPAAWRLVEHMSDR